jgi:hypothetical protein
MSAALDHVDWPLLHQQKLVLLELLDGLDRNSPTAESLSGLVHLLDALQDEAAAQGRWTFPGETPASPAVSKRYYVEAEDGHHFGPLQDYDEAVSIADAIHGRIIVQEVEATDSSEDETPDDDEGGE